MDLPFARREAGGAKFGDGVMASLSEARFWIRRIACVAGATKYQAPIAGDPSIADFIPDVRAGMAAWPLRIERADFCRRDLAAGGLLESPPACTTWGLSYRPRFRNSGLLRIRDIGLYGS